MQHRDGACDPTTKGYICNNFAGICEHGKLKPAIDRRKKHHCGVCDDAHRNEDGRCVLCASAECDEGFVRTGVCSDDSDG